MFRVKVESTKIRALVHQRIGEISRQPLECRFFNSGSIRAQTRFAPTFLYDLLFSGNQTSVSLLVLAGYAIHNPLMKHLPLIAAIVLTLLSAPLTHASPSHTKGRAVVPFTPALKPGDYVWHPEISPAGPVVLLVSLPEQVMYVYRNGVRIGRTTVSTGKQGKDTPPGVFTVLQKKVDHESNIYKGAKMPNMQRLTWSGIALHAGQLPGYRASAGCVRMPVDFAAKLYKVTSIGTTVIIADSDSSPSHTVRPGLLFSGKTGEAGRFGWMPEKAPKGPVSVIVSRADRAAYVYRNGIEIGRAPVGGIERLTGSYVYSALATVDSSGRRDWISTAGVGGHAPNLKNLAQHVAIAPDFLANIRALITPGTTLIITDASVNSRARSTTSFSIRTN
jgi:L,D-transpeptidase catalytic domain